MPNTPLKGDYNTYIGARYVPIIGGMWNQQTEYEPLTIVMYQGSSYTSKTFVPKGTQIDNTTYWVRTANYDEQVEFYRQEVQQYKKDIDASEAEYIATVQKAQEEFTTATNNNIEQFKKDTTNSQKNFTDSITKQQNEYEASITKQVSDYQAQVLANNNTPHIVNNVSDMTDSTKIYVLSSDMHIYQYNGTSFIDTGVIFANLSGAVALLSIDSYSYIEYNNDTNELTIPQGFIVYSNVQKGITKQVIKLSDVETTYNAYVLKLNTTDATVYAIAWYYSNDNNPTVGYIWGSNIFINGIDNRYIKIISNDKEFINTFPINSAYIMTDSYRHGSNVAVLTMDTNNNDTYATLQINVGIVLVNNKLFVPKNKIINVTFPESTEHAYWLCVDVKNSTIFAKIFNEGDAQKYPIAGYLYNKTLCINGIPDYAITVNTLNQRQNNIAFISDNGEGIANYNTKTKILTIDKIGWININGGFIAVGGIKFTVDLSGITVSDNSNAYILTFSPNDNNFHARSYNDRNAYCGSFVGFIYGNRVFINGITNVCVDGTNTNNLGVGFIGLLDKCIVTKENNAYMIKIPNGFVTNGTDTNGITSTVLTQTDDNSADGCSLIKYSKNTGLYLDKWKKPNADITLGWFWGEYLYLNGISQDRIDYNVEDVLFFGDSITAGTGTSSPYHVRLAELLPIVDINWGVGSTGYVTTATGVLDTGNGNIGDGVSMNQTGNNTVLDIMKNVSNIPKCIIAAGTNDAFAQKPLDVFRTAVQNTLDYALSKTPYVMVITPIRREGDKNLAISFTSYVDIIKEESKERGIPIIDGYNAPLNPNNSVNKSKYFSTDGIHLNEEGSKRFGEYMAEQVMWELPVLSKYQHT